jgi:hypothetical protein
MQVREFYLIPVLAVAATTLGLVAAPSAAADCNYSGGSTICAHGTVRGSSGAPTSVPAYDPYPCTGDPTCYLYDNYDPDIIVDPSPPIRPIRPGGPGGPGGGGGIGPR